MVISSHIHWPLVEKLKYWPVMAKLLMKVTEERDLDHLATDRVDLHPVAHSNAVLAHQHEPAEEGEDEVLHDDGDAGGGEAEDGGHVVGSAEDDEEDGNEAEDLDAELEDGSEGLDAPAVEFGTVEELADEQVKEHDDDKSEDDGGERLQDEMQYDAVLQENLRGPAGVDGSELLLGLDAVVVDAEELALR